jgi:hypothetical protein
MARGLVRFLVSRPVFVVAVLWLGWVVVTALWPASWWLSVDRKLAFDGPAGAPVVLDVERRIHRPFVADWSVLVRRWTPGGWTVACAARGGGDYRPDAALPTPVTLGWWTDGKCSALPAGRYFVSTVWTIRAGDLWPEKLLHVDSNVFTVE